MHPLLWHLPITRDGPTAVLFLCSLSLSTTRDDPVEEDSNQIDVLGHSASTLPFNPPCPPHLLLFFQALEFVSRMLETLLEEDSASQAKQQQEEAQAQTPQSSVPSTPPSGAQGQAKPEEGFGDSTIPGDVADGSSVLAERGAGAAAAGLGTAAGGGGAWKDATDASDSESEAGSTSTKGGTEDSRAEASEGAEGEGAGGEDGFPSSGPGRSQSTLFRSQLARCARWQRRLSLMLSLIGANLRVGIESLVGASGDAVTDRPLALCLASAASLLPSSSSSGPADSGAVGGAAAGVGGGGGVGSVGIASGGGGSVKRTQGQREGSVSVSLLGHSTSSSTPGLGPNTGKGPSVSSSIHPHLPLTSDSSTAPSLASSTHGSGAGSVAAGYAPGTAAGAFATVPGAGGGPGIGAGPGAGAGAGAGGVGGSIGAVGIPGAGGGEESDPAGDAAGATRAREQALAMAVSLRDALVDDEHYELALHLCDLAQVRPRPPEP